MSHETIASEEMLRDIADTEAEIETMEREIKAFRLLGDRWSLMKADARVTGIQKRMELIVKVKALLAARGGSGR